MIWALYCTYSKLDSELGSFLRLSLTQNIFMNSLTPVYKVLWQLWRLNVVEWVQEIIYLISLRGHKDRYWSNKMLIASGVYSNRSSPDSSLNPYIARYTSTALTHCFRLNHKRWNEMMHGVFWMQRITLMSQSSSSKYWENIYYFTACCIIYSVLDISLPAEMRFPQWNKSLIVVLNEQCLRLCGKRYDLMWPTKIPPTQLYRQHGPLHNEMYPPFHNRCSKLAYPLLNVHVTVEQKIWFIGPDCFSHYFINQMFLVPLKDLLQVVYHYLECYWCGGRAGVCTSGYLSSSVLWYELSWSIQLFTGRDLRTCVLRSMSNCLSFFVELGIAID